MNFLVRLHNKTAPKRILFLLFALILPALLYPFNLNAVGALTSVKDTLSTSRPSVATAFGGNGNPNDTTITVGSTLGLAQGDTITLCTTNTCTSSENRVIASIPSVTQLNLTTGLTGTYTSGTSYLYLKMTSKHTITFTTRSAVTAGKFVITMPGDGTGANNSIPGASGFDFNGITAGDISLTGGTAGTITTSSPASNVVITVPFTGTIAAATAITITIGNTNKLLNPTKTAVQGTADTYAVQVDEQDGSSNIVDTTTGRVGVIESVSATATVVPTLTFTINPVNSGTTVAGTSMDVTTTATTVPLGTLTVSTNRTAAQFIHIDTNSNSGYIVTAQSDGSLRKTNGTVISDYNVTAADNNAANGFGYALQTKAGSPTMTFNYNDSGRTFNSAGFNSSSSVTIMSNNAPASGDEGYVAYRVRVGATQPQGTYQNLITYIATAIY